MFELFLYASDRISVISEFILRYAIVLAASGALTMALLEAWKKIVGTEAKFHRNSVLLWLENDSAKLKRYVTRTGSGVAYSPARAYEELLFLTTGLGSEDSGKERFNKSVEHQQEKMNRFHPSIEYALFQLEIERLMGQIQDAADVALNNPNLYEHFFNFITRGASKEDVLEWKQVSSLADDIDNDQKKAKEVANLYTRLKQAIRRHLDSFQIITTHRWQNGNQLAAAVLGMVVLFIAQLIANSSSEAFEGWQLLGVLISSVFGGMLAPIAKDLVDALRKAKCA
jgi:hypothetical protein